MKLKLDLDTVTQSTPEGIYIAMRQDWIAMHAELSTLRQNLKEAVEEMNVYANKSEAYYGLIRAIDILRKHNLIQEE